MMYIVLVLRSLLCYCMTGVAALLFFVPCLFVAALTPQKWRFKNRVLFWLLHGTYQSVRYGFLLRIRFMGNKIPSTPAIIVANHESSLDIVLLGGLLRAQPHMWYALNRFFNTPILGFLLRRISISVDQEHPIRAARAVIQGISIARREHLSSVLFPEGGRYTDGMIHEFFSGFAMIAKRLGQPVVPVMMRNVGKVYPPGSFIIRPYPIEVIIGPAFMVHEYDTDEVFVQRVRQWFIDQTVL